MKVKSGKIRNHNKVVVGMRAAVKRSAFFLFLCFCETLTKNLHVLHKNMHGFTRIITNYIYLCTVKPL